MGLGIKEEGRIWVLLLLRIFCLGNKMLTYLIMWNIQQRATIT
jgi:hypothetical protein